MSRGFTTLVVAAVFVIVRPGIAEDQQPLVRTIRVPYGGIQPQIAVGGAGGVHLIFYKGDAGAGDVFYVRSTNEGQTFSEPVHVNSQPGSAVAAGTIRGAHLALGVNDRVHVAWNGSGKAIPKGLPNPDLPENSPYRLGSPMLYSRINDAGTEFEPQRNFMTHTYALDGGGSVAADDKGNVYVVWHANSTEGQVTGEAGRAVWVATSRDGGQTFAAETRANDSPTGACGCCGLRAAADRDGNLYVLYRSATDTVHRDMYLLVSKDRGDSFSAAKLDEWQVPQCVMSSAALYDTLGDMLAGWETERQIHFARLGERSLKDLRILSAPGPGTSRKHPVLATNSQGYVILAWTEGTGWQRGGSVAWQVFDESGHLVSDGAGRADGVPVWSFAAVFPRQDGGFTVVY